MEKANIDFSEITRLFSSESNFFEKAFLALSTVNPEIKRDFAILLYKEDKISLLRASEIAGLSFFEFERVLEVKGIEKKTYSGTEDESKKSMEYLKEYV
jgi:predicted HTH domain antitoxin